MFWNEEAECMSKEKKEELQLERLQKTVKHAYDNIEFYKKRFDEIGLKPEDIKTLKDIEKIPFTTKSDLREAYPLGLLAVPREDIVEVHASSGTTWAQLQYQFQQEIPKGNSTPWLISKVTS